MSFAVVLSKPSCPKGFNLAKQKCIDDDECDVEDDYAAHAGPCGENAACINTHGSFYCRCVDGFRSSTKTANFSAETSATCKDINECVENAGLCGPNALCSNTIPHYTCRCDDGFSPMHGMEMIHRIGSVACRDIDECEKRVCGQNAACINTPGSYVCVCHAGFGLKSGRANFSGRQEQCEDMCVGDKTICGNGACHHGARGHYCACHAGSTDYGDTGSRCSALNCDVFHEHHLRELKESRVAHELVTHLGKSCLALTESKTPTKLDGDDTLERLLSAVDKLLSSGSFKDNRKVSAFLGLAENGLRFIGPLLEPPGTTRSSTHTELQLLVHKGVDLPQGSVTLSLKQAQLDIHLETAAGDPVFYPGFTTVSLLSYANLEDSADGFFSGMKSRDGQRFRINSKIVTATVSNRNTSHLEEPVQITFYHLKQSNGSSHICVFWDPSEGEGTWSPRGCSVAESSPEYTVCSCNHLSSFAVLMALYEIEDKFELQLITWVGLSLSLICLFLCILTFSLVRSIRSPRTTIHLHLCISLFIATLIFLVGISQTENQVGCAVVAGFLHFFYLAAFCWMCLEGIQLFRMVVLVFNTNFKPLCMMVGGYGVPAVIVAVSALTNAKGYGTERYCWINLELIWSFLGPACIIIIINIFFFIITVWKLAQKFSSLNPDLDKLQKIKAFTITAVAQLCVLGTMWIFGCFQFEKGTIIMSYLFTIFGSLQGVMLFAMHCLLAKQVREEYGNILSRLCAPTKKRHSELSWSNSAKAQASKSTQDTGESHM
ncbi:adhesion G protein-coupled receptor E2 [Brachionichthys hirsutus]|uniref:adhesion G protein-coupled receptor E2 n=1 Tax=Brachionichthys hirsutus TaxID=412623 RepID=UPI0036052C35